MLKFNLKLLIKISCLFGVAIFWLLDRWLKGIALGNINTSHICDKIICWHPNINPQLAFNLPSPLYLIILLNIIIGVFLFWWYSQSKSWGKIALISIIFGGLSNLMDRITHQGVIDYIQVGWWPIFNLADVLIVVGILWLLYDSMIRNKKK